MDLRTVYLQEILQVSDFLQMQRNALRAMSVGWFSLFGGKTVACTLPTAVNTSQTTKALPSVSGLTLTVPPIAIYQCGQVDASTWSSLGADTTPLLIQGINFAGTNKTVVVPSGANKRIDLIQARLTAATDDAGSAVILPYYPLIQTTTLASCTTTKIYVSSTSGMTVGDQVTISGFAAAGNPALTIATISSDGGGAFFTLGQTLTGAPGANVTVRDVNPNSGAPLSGPANGGASQTINRVYTVEIGLKQGTPTTGTPTFPAPDSGWVALYTIGNAGAGYILNGTTDVSGMTTIAQDGTGADISAFWPGLVNPGRGHHHGTAGESTKIDLVNETNYIPLNNQNNSIISQTGEVIINSTAGTAGYDFNLQRTAPANETKDGIKLTNNGSSVSFLDFVSGLGMRWIPSGGAPSSQAINVPRLKTGLTVGTGATNQAITVGFQPLAVAMYTEINGGGHAYFWFCDNSSKSLFLDFITGSSTVAVLSSTSMALTSTGFTFSSALPGLINHYWAAWG